MTPLVKVCVLTKNEYDVIEDFILFYGSLFGYENVHIVDNGSTNEHVLAVYEKYKKKGIEVVVDTSHFTSQGDIVTRHLQRLKSSAKWLIPLDTDEFIFFTDGSPINQDRIRIYFENLPEDVSIVRFKSFYGSSPDPTDSSYINYKHERPARNIIRFYDQNWDKIFVRASAFIQCQAGNHSAIVTGGKRIVSDTLGLLHFHETGVYRQYERAVQAVEGRSHVSTTAPLEQQITSALKYRGGIGGHHCAIYLRFLARMFMIALWKREFGDQSLPSGEDVMWAHTHSNDVDVMYKIAKYVSEADPNKPSSNQDTARTENDLIFGCWPPVHYDFVIPTVAQYLKSQIEVEAI